MYYQGYIVILRKLCATDSGIKQWHNKSPKLTPTRTGFTSKAAAAQLSSPFGNKVTRMNERFYSAFGILTAAFSSMEADVRSLICGIAFGGNAVIASSFMDSSQLGGNLNVLRKLSMQYWDKEELFLDIVKSIESIRLIRNLFIHGIWVSGNFGEPNGYASVTDLKTKYEKDEKKRTWTHGQTTEYNINDFQDILDNVNSIKQKIEDLCESFESEDDDMHFGMEGRTVSMPPIRMPLSSNVEHS